MRYNEQVIQPKKEPKKPEVQEKPKPGQYTSEHLATLGGKHGRIQWTK